LGTVPRRPVRALTVIDGHVTDALTGEALPTAVVRFRPAAGGAEIAAEVARDGAFQTPAMLPGQYVFRATASAYNEVQASFSLPHAGEGSKLRVGLWHLRQLARFAHLPVLERAAPSEKLARVWTPRDALAHMRSQAREPALLAPLTESIERALYAQAPPTTEDIDAIQTLAQAVAAHLDAERSDAASRRR